MTVAANLWRRGTPGHVGWSRVARPGVANKHFMVLCDKILGGNATRCFKLDDLVAKRGARG